MRGVNRAADRPLLNHHGTLPRDSVAELFASADVFLDMSHWQAWGRTGLEAMAAGCVPVLPKGSGASEYRGGAEISRRARGRARGFGPRASPFT